MVYSAYSIFNFKGGFMDQDFNQNMEALIAYSHTERFQSLWKDHGDIEYLAARSQIFLEIFNTFKSKLENPSNEKVKDLIQLLTKREFFISLVNEGISVTMKEIAKVLKLKEEVKESIEIPKFHVGEAEYEYFFQKAQEAYLESDLYHVKRHSLGTDFAKHSFYAHWKLLGEVFNRVIAQEYVQSLQNKNKEDIPVIYKHTMSGEKFFGIANKVQEKQVMRRTI